MNDRRSPALGSVEAARSPGRRDGIRRMFKPPDWEWSAVRGALAGGLATVGARYCWALRGCASTNGASRRAHDDQVGASSRRLSRRPSRGNDLRQALPGSRLACHASPVGSARQGRNEGKRSQHLAIDRSADHHAGRAGRMPKAQVSLRELPGHAGDFLRRLHSTSSSSDIFAGEPEPSRSQIRQKLAEAMAVMTARLHDAGLLHQDFHPGNIMVRLDRRQSPELFMIDLDALRKMPRRDLEAGPTKPGAARPLLLAAQQPHRPLSLFEDLPAKPVESRPPTSRGFAREIEETTRLWAERLWRRWGRRCLRRTSTSKRRARRITWCVASRDLDPLEIEPLLEDPDLPFRRPGDDPVKTRAPRRSPRRRWWCGGCRRQVIYKRFNRKKWLDPLLTLFRPSRAWRSWQAGQHLASRGIPTPQNLAFVSRRRSFKNRPALLVPAPRNLPDHRQGTGRRRPGRLHPQGTSGALLPTGAARIRSLTVSLAELIRSLHDRSLSHRDLKASNILLNVGSPTAGSSLSVIDLVGVQLRHPLPRQPACPEPGAALRQSGAVPGRNRSDLLAISSPLPSLGPFAA